MTARLSLRIGSTAVLALGGTTPARSFHVSAGGPATRGPTAPAAAFHQGPVAPWGVGRYRARSTDGRAGQLGWAGAGEGRGRTRRLPGG